MTDIEMKLGKGENVIAANDIVISDRDRAHIMDLLHAGAEQLSGDAKG